MVEQRLWTDEEKREAIQKFSELRQAGKMEEAIKIMQPYPLDPDFVKALMWAQEPNYIEKLRELHNLAEFDEYMKSQKEL